MFIMNPQKKIARTAGLLYLIVVLTGIFSLLYVPSKLFDWDNASATFTNIAENETLFRLSIVAGIVCYTAFLFLPLVLYKLLCPVNKTHAVAMVALAVVSVPISLVNLLNKVNILTHIGNKDYASTIPVDPLHSNVLLYLDYYENGITLASLFWGLWLFPFGYLVYRSGFLPKALGILLMAGCFGYLINILGGFLYKDYGALGIARFVQIPASLGEIGSCLWLLIVGVTTNKKPIVSN